MPPLNASHAEENAPKPWSAFDPPPMTIVHPVESAPTNPPFLSWQGTDKARSYRIKLTGAGEALEWETPFDFHTPEKALPAGAWRLEVEALGADGKTLQPHACCDFRLPEKAPSPGASMNDISFEPGKPFLLTRADIRRIAMEQDETAAMREALLNSALPLDSEIAGTLIEPRRYVDFKWDFHTWHNNNQYVLKIEDAVLANTMAWLLTKKKGHRDAVRRLVMELTAWEPDGATGMWENDHSAHAIMNALTIAYNSLHKEFSEKERTAIRGCIAIRCEDAYGLLHPFVVRETSSGPMNDPDNNHPWFSASALGMGAMALMGEHERAGEWLSWAAQLYWGLFLTRGGKDGGWHEGIDYWSYALFFVFQFADALKKATGVNLYNAPWLRNTALFKIYTHPPAGAYVPFGDCKHHRPNAFDKTIMMRLASEYGNPMAWKYVDAIAEPVTKPRHLFWALLWSHRGQAAEKTLPPLPASRHFESIGWVVANSDVFRAERQELFAFRSGPFHGRAFGHTHADQNSFVYTAAGEKLLWDSGYYDSYLSPHHRNYSRLSQAHNTVLIDGTGQVVHVAGIDGCITKYEPDEEGLIVQGDASKPLIYGGRLARFMRTIKYRKGLLLEIEDDLLAREPVRFSFLLHSAYPIVFHPGSNHITILGESRALEGRFDSDHPVEAVLRHGFVQEPTLTSKVLDEDMRYPDQFHLELRTLHRIETWRPKASFRLVSLPQDTPRPLGRTSRLGSG